MMREPSRVAFRAQLVIAEQCQLFDYWLERAAGAPMPARRDIRPGDIPHLLPNISLIEIHRSPYGCDSVWPGRGSGTSMIARSPGSIWTTSTGVDRPTIGARRTPGWQIPAGPAQGVVRSPRASKDHLVHFWLRLPLVTDGPEAAMILGYDVSVPVSEMPGVVDRSARRRGGLSRRKGTPHCASVRASSAFSACRSPKWRLRS
jgi:hypothetical protein